MVVLFHPRAAEDVATIDAWWRANRRKAPTLFRQELEDTVSLIASTPTLGRPAEDDDDLLGVRRTLMRRTRHHVYYQVSGDTIEVLAVWHAVRGEPPVLD